MTESELQRARVRALIKNWEQRLSHQLPYQNGVGTIYGVHGLTPRVQKAIDHFVDKGFRVTINRSSWFNFMCDGRYGLTFERAKRTVSVH